MPVSVLITALSDHFSHSVNFVYHISHVTLSLLGSAPRSTVQIAPALADSYSVFKHTGECLQEQSLFHDMKSPAFPLYTSPSLSLTRRLCEDHFCLKL